MSRTLLGEPLHGLRPRLLGELRPARLGEPTKEDGGDEGEVRRLLRALEAAAGEGPGTADEAGRERRDGV